MQLIWRSLTKAPQPAKTSIWCFICVFLSMLILLIITGSTWVFSIGAVLAGLSLFLFGLCYFRDIHATATTASRIYKESRGIDPEGFTFADVPTLKAIGFGQMLIGALFIVIGIMALIEG